MKLNAKKLGFFIGFSGALLYLGCMMVMLTASGTTTVVPQYKL